MKHIKQSIIYFFVICLSLLTLQNCGGGGGGSKKVVYPGMVTPEIQGKFNQIERQYRQKNYSYAFAGYQNFIESYEHTKLTDEAYYKQGKIFFLQSRLKDAANKFKELASKTPNPKYKAKAQYMVAYSHYKREQYNETLDGLKRVMPNNLPTKMQVQYYSLVIKSAKNTTDANQLQDYATLKLYDTYESFAGSKLRNLRRSDLISYEKTKNLLASWISTPLLSSQIVNWMTKYDKASPARAYVDFKLGKMYFEEKKFSKAKRYLISFITKFPKNKYSSSARKMLDAMGEVDIDVNLKKANYAIGVLVPLAGRHETYGYSVLDGVKCAAGTNNSCGPESGVKLIVKDSGYSTESVRRAVAELAHANVAAIIGPLSGELAIEAGIMASQYKVPIFPITQKTGLMAQGSYIFQIGMQPKQQIEELVKAARSKGLKSFGIFHPNTNYGQTMAELFMEEARRNGCKITAMAEYNKWSKDTYAEARKLKKSIGRIGAPDRGIGFDAIFIPDSYQNVNAMVGALEYNGITGIPLLGTNAWNDPGLSLKIAEKFPKSFFIDLYNGTSNNNKVESFNQQFITGFGRAPRVLEAYGYDIMMLIREIASDRGARNIQDALAEGRGYRGVTGIRGFLSGDSPIIDSSALMITTTGVKAY